MAHGRIKAFEFYALVKGNRLGHCSLVGNFELSGFEFSFETIFRIPMCFLSGSNDARVSLDRTEAS